MPTLGFDSEEFDAKAHVASRFVEADNADAEAEFVKANPDNKAARGTNEIGEWVRKLPKNISIGVMDAGLAAADFAEDALEEAEPGIEKAKGIGPLAPAAFGAQFGLQAYKESGIRDTLMQFRNHMAEGSNAGDTITQGIAQFAVPFAGWARAMGGISKMHGFARNLLTAAGAETATSAVNLMPDTGRFADLIELGRHAENRFGDALRALTPDDGLLTSYVNYLSEREGDNVWEGRFKNVVDSLGTSAAVAGVVKTAATAFKGARSLLGQSDVAHETNLRASPVFDVEAAATYERVTDALLTRVEAAREAAGPNAAAKNHPIEMADLIADLDKSVPKDDAYRIVVDKLLKQDLKGKVRFLSDKEYAEKAGETSSGKSFTRSHKENDEIFINIDKLMKTGRAREAVGYTAMHELTHAGTVRNMRRDPDLLASIKDLSDQTKETAPDNPAKYGYTNAFEFVAEAFSNMKFQNAMKKAGTWEPFIQKIGTVFGISGAALKVFEQVIQQPQEAQRG